MTETYATPKDWQWFPFGVDQDPDGDFEVVTERYRRRLCLPDRIVGVLTSEMAELHVVLWESDDDDGNWWFELCAFGDDGYASKVMLSDWIETTVTKSRVQPKHGKLNAIKNLQKRLSEIVAKIEADQ
jgi:hypothetical protein